MALSRKNEVSTIATSRSQGPISKNVVRLNLQLPVELKRALDEQAASLQTTVPRLARKFLYQGLKALKRKQLDDQLIAGYQYLAQENQQLLDEFHVADSQRAKPPSVPSEFSVHSVVQCVFNHSQQVANLPTSSTDRFISGTSPVIATLSYSQRTAWLIDPVREWAEFYGLTATGHYRPIVSGSEGIFRSDVIAGFWLKIEWLWQSPPVLQVLRELGLIR